MQQKLKLKLQILINVQNVALVILKKKKLRMKFTEIPSFTLFCFIEFYQNVISPRRNKKGHFCRYYPTCSEYAVQALKIHGPFKGFWLASKRISKCHPWGTHGYDPVPPKQKKKTE